MTLARVCRWIAIALAVLAIVDPRIPLPRRTRPYVRVLAAKDGSDMPIRAQLNSHGFSSSGDAEVATVATRGATVSQLPSTPLYVVDPEGPDVAIEDAAVGEVRVPGQAVSVVAAVRGRRMAGHTTVVRLQDGGLTLTTATHRWTSDDERWQATLTYLPAETGSARLRVRADGVEGESDAENNLADVLVPPQRGPIRALVFAPSVTWPAVFVRRTFEADPAFDVASLQRATKSVAAKAGPAPATLTVADLEPYDVLISATLDFDGTARDAVRWFVEQRGGVAVFVPDRLPDHADALIPGLSFQSRTVETPLALRAERGGLVTSELLVPRGLPPLASVLASDATGAPIVFSARRGAGAVIVSGALDAWRSRDSRFDEFWKTSVLAEAVTVPPRLDVTVTPAIARPGDRVRIVARLRATELPARATELALPPAVARAVAPGAHVDEPIRLWPATAPGVYEGEWTAARAGDYAIDVSIRSSTAAAVLAIDSGASRPYATRTAAAAAHLTGGGVFADETSAIRALAARFPASTRLAPARPARTAWWAAAFAVLLCTEWALRRRRGLP